MKILLAVDGSEQSYDAARGLRHMKQAQSVLVLTAVKAPLPAYPMVVLEATREIRTMVETAMREDAERLLKRVVSILPDGIGPVTTRIADDDPAGAIVKTAKEEQVDLIVMGARGIGQMRELFLGSVSHRVVTQAACPVLLVKNSLPKLQRILLPLDSPADAEAALTFFETKPFRTPPDVTVLTVLPMAQPLWPVGVTDSAPLREAMQKSACCFVEDVAGKLSGMGYCAVAETRIGMPAPTVLKHAEESQADVIAVRSRGKGPLSMFGSVSHAVVHGTPGSVLIFR